jgi:hypothetical protein
MGIVVEPKEEYETDGSTKGGIGKAAWKSAWYLRSCTTPTVGKSSQITDWTELGPIEQQVARERCTAVHSHYCKWS